MKKMIALAAVFCCVAMAQRGPTEVSCNCDDGKGCGCVKPTKTTEVVEEGKGCDCVKPSKAQEVK